MPHFIPAGRVPIDPALTRLQDQGQGYADALPQSHTFQHVRAILEPVLQSHA